MLANINVDRDNEIVDRDNVVNTDYFNDGDDFEEGDLEAGDFSRVYHFKEHEVFEYNDHCRAYDDNAEHLVRLFGGRGLMEDGLDGRQEALVL